MGLVISDSDKRVLSSRSMSSNTVCLFEFLSNSSKYFEAHNLAKRAGVSLPTLNQNHFRLTTLSETSRTNSLKEIIGANQYHIYPMRGYPAFCRELLVCSNQNFFETHPLADLTLFNCLKNGKDITSHDFKQIIPFSEISTKVPSFEPLRDRNVILLVTPSDIVKDGGRLVIHVSSVKFKRVSRVKTDTSSYPATWLFDYPLSSSPSYEFNYTYEGNTMLKSVIKSVPIDNDKKHPTSSGNIVLDGLGYYNNLYGDFYGIKYPSPTSINTLESYKKSPKDVINNYPFPEISQVAAGDFNVSANVAVILRDIMLQNDLNKFLSVLHECVEREVQEWHSAHPPLKPLGSQTSSSQSSQPINNYQGGQQKNGTPMSDCFTNSIRGTVR